MSEHFSDDPTFRLEPQVRWDNSGRAWYGTLCLGAGVATAVYALLPSSWVSAADAPHRLVAFLVVATLLILPGLLFLLGPTAIHSSVRFRPEERMALPRAVLSGVGIAWFIVTVVDVNLFAALPAWPVWAHFLLHVVGLVPAVVLWDSLQRQILSTWYMFARAFSL